MPARDRKAATLSPQMDLAGMGPEKARELLAAALHPDPKSGILRLSDQPCLYVCPSKVYRLDKDELVYNTEGCIELGACAIVCKHLGKDAIRWNYPRGSYGVEFRFG